MISSQGLPSLVIQVTTVSTRQFTIRGCVGLAEEGGGTVGGEVGESVGGMTGGKAGGLAVGSDGDNVGGSVGLSEGRRVGSKVSKGRVDGSVCTIDGGNVGRRVGGKVVVSVGTMVGSSRVVGGAEVGAFMLMHMLPPCIKRSQKDTSSFVVTLSAARTDTAMDKSSIGDKHLMFESLSNTVTAIKESAITFPVLLKCFMCSCGLFAKRNDFLEINKVLRPYVTRVT